MWRLKLSNKNSLKSDYLRNTIKYKPQYHLVIKLCMLRNNAHYTEHILLIQKA